MHFILGANSYMFRHQGAVFGIVSPTRTSGASRTHFRHKCYKSYNVKIPN